MALQKVKDSMRTTTALDSTKLSGAVPTAALSNVDLVEGTKGADIASSSTIVIGTDGGYFDITGTTGISTMTVAAGRVFTLQFDGVVTLTHSATLYLSGAANFTTEANDHMTFISVAANDVRQIGTGLKDGGSPVAAAGGAWTLIGTSEASNSANLTITGLSSTHDTYAICISAIRPVTDGNGIFIRLGDSSGIDSGGTDYAYHRQSVSTASTSYASHYTPNVSSILVGAGVGNATGEGLGGVLYLTQPGDSAVWPLVTGSLTEITSTPTTFGGVLVAVRQAAVTVDRVLLASYSGNLTSGRMSIFGISHT